MMFRMALAKDARVLVRHRALLAALLAYPFLLALVLGAAFADPPTRLDLAVMNQDAEGASVTVGGESFDSATLVGRLGAFAEVRLVDSEEDGLALLRQGDVDALLVIPRNFVRDISLIGQVATLEVVVDESDPVRAQVAENAVRGGIDSFTRFIVQKKIDDVLALLDLTVEGGKTRVATVEVQVLGLQNARQRLSEVLSTLDPQGEPAKKVREVIVFLDFAAGFLGNADRYLSTTALPLEVETSGITAPQTRLAAVALPGALVLGVFWTGALAASLLVARDVETGVSRRLAAAPASRATLAASKVGIAFAAALLPALVLVGLGVLLLGARVASPALLFVGLAAAALAAAALGGLAATLARGSSAAALLVVLTILPMLILGGLFYPVAYMPEAVQAVASWLPMTLATDVLRGGMLRGSSLAESWRALVGLLVFTVISGAIALRVPREA